jgi:hypothetical protein
VNLELKDVSVVRTFGATIDLNPDRRRISRDCREFIGFRTIFGSWKRGDLAKWLIVI